jgi:hypothetical protein
MDDIQTYQIEVRGPLNEKNINSMSPVQIEVVQEGSEPPQAATLLTVCTDQSGFIRLLRHLHGRGIVLLSVHQGR